MTIEQIISVLSTIRPDSTFLAINGYKSVETSEISNFQLAFHMSYANALERAILDLECFIPDNELQVQAKEELLASYKKSFDKTNEPAEELVGDHYRRVTDAYGKTIKGIKIHNESNNLHLFGRLVHKQVITPGIYKPSNPRPLTIAKDEIRKNFAVNKFRQFVIKPGQFDSITVEKMTLTLDEA